VGAIGGAEGGQAMKAVENKQHAVSVEVIVRRALVRTVSTQRIQRMALIIRCSVDDGTTTTVTGTLDGINDYVYLLLLPPQVVLRQEITQSTSWRRMVLRVAATPLLGVLSDYLMACARSVVDIIHMTLGLIRDLPDIL
jgi:hypothetical protein